MSMNNGTGAGVRFSSHVANRADSINYGGHDYLDPETMVDPTLTPQERAKISFGAWLTYGADYNGRKTVKAYTAGEELVGICNSPNFPSEQTTCSVFVYGFFDGGRTTGVDYSTLDLTVAKVLITSVTTIAKTNYGEDSTLSTIYKLHAKTNL